MLKAVLFDRDGVILDSESTNVQSALRSFNELGITIPENEYKHFAGKHPDEYIKFFKEKYTFDANNFRDRQRFLYYELLATTPVFESTISLIGNLKNEGVVLALTTAAGPESTAIVLQKTGLTSTFSEVITSADYQNRKPDPEVYLLTAKRLNIDTSECIVIEDSLVGVQAAKSAGMVCIAMPGKYTKEQDFSIADAIVDSASEIDLPFLQSFF